MIKNIPIEKIMFLDIETVPQSEGWSDLDEQTQHLWDKKTKAQRKEDISADVFFEDRAGIMAEFGKIICISIGMIDGHDQLKINHFMVIMKRICF